VGDLAFEDDSRARRLKRLAGAREPPDVQAAARASNSRLTRSPSKRQPGARRLGRRDYTKTGRQIVGVRSPFDLPFRDRDQGNIAHAEVAVWQAQRPVRHALRAARRRERIRRLRHQPEGRALPVRLSRSGAQVARDFAYVCQHGAGTIPDLLDAEQTYRDTQLAYRQALAAS
jgi:hypothetical protein